MTISAYNLTGWHTATSAKKEHMKENNEHIMHNLFRAMGYLPVTGVLTGLTEITRSKKSDIATRAYMVVRCIFQMLGLGVVFLIPDVAVSIHRHLYKA